MDRFQFADFSKGVWDPIREVGLGEAPQGDQWTLRTLSNVKVPGDSIYLGNYGNHPLKTKRKIGKWLVAYYALTYENELDVSHGGPFLFVSEDHEAGMGFCLST